MKRLVLAMMIVVVLSIVLSVIVFHTEIRVTQPNLVSKQITLTNVNMVVEPKYYPPDIGLWMGSLKSCNGTIVSGSIDLVNSGDIGGYANVGLLVSGKMMNTTRYYVAAHSVETKYPSWDVPDCTIHREDTNVIISTIEIP